MKTRELFLTDQCTVYTTSDSNTNISSNSGETVVNCNRGQKPSVGDGHLHCHAGHWVPDGLKCIDNGLLL